MATCYLALGSNLRHPIRQLRQAIKHLRAIPHTIIIEQSKIYRSAPLGVRKQPPYCNMVVAIHTSLSANNLLLYCQNIEKLQSRIKKQIWGSRTIDLDILLFEKQKINTRNLIIPHPQLTQRDFVLIPLLEISPNLTLPNGTPIRNYLYKCERYTFHSL